MPNQVPKDLEVITVIDFQDRGNHYLQSYKGQLIFQEREITTLHGDLGISECRAGKYEVYPQIPRSQFSIENGTHTFHRFYNAYRINEPEGMMPERV
ncbi:MAG: hypothetical protein Q8P15_03640 [Nanoarchaeota archaeon]|nr:hypothetical protein [Nanoarchaeota archaeon]